MSEDDEIVLDPSVVRRRLNRALSESDEQKPTVESEVEDSDDEVKSVKPKRSRKRRKKSGKGEDRSEKVKTPSATEHREVCNADNESERVIGDDRGASELVEQFHTTPEVEKTCVETPDDHTSGETKEDDIEVVVESKDAIDGASTESDECESSEYEDDGIDYSFEGYGDIDDPDVVEEVLPSEEGAVEFDSIRAWAETLESAIPVADLISSTLSNAGVEVSEDQLIGFDGIYVCHEKHLKPVRFSNQSDECYFGASEVMPEVMEIYEVEGLTGFWQFTGVEFSDLETAVNFASMIRFVPANGRYPNTFGYWELVIVVRSDRFSLMARMNVEPMLLINAGLVRDFGKTPK